MPSARAGAAACLPPSAQLLGIDFTSTPSRRKPITVARGLLVGDLLRLQRVDRIEGWREFEHLLLAPGPWLAAIDTPLGLPRPFVESLGLGSTLGEVVSTLRSRCAKRMDFRALVDSWGSTRPAGQRLVHRRTDAAEPGAHTTSPLQTRYVPVGFMFFEAVPRLLKAGVSLPGLAAGDDSRVVLEGYPGMLAYELLGARSYKNSPAPDRRAARAGLISSLMAGDTRLGLSLKLPRPWHEQLIDDTSGDLLDATLCLMQAAWASRQSGYGLPPDADPVEGWVTSARWRMP